MGPSISKKLQTPELQEVRSHGRRIIGAKTMKQTISDSFLAKEAVPNAISGYIQTNYYSLLFGIDVSFQQELYMQISEKIYIINHYLN